MSETKPPKRPPGRPRTIPAEHVRISATVDRGLLGEILTRTGAASPGAAVSRIIEAAGNDSALLSRLVAAAGANPEESDSEAACPTGT